MEQVSLDVWVLIGKKLDLSDLRAFFLVSRVHSRVTGREDFWRFVCQKNYGNWNLGDFDQKTWKGIVRWITERRNFIKTMELPYECYGSISFVIEEQTNRFYIRSPDRTTFYYEDEFPTGARNGDTKINPTESGKLSFCFKKDQTTSLNPPPENCWPNKPIEYSQIDVYVYIFMTANNLSQMWNVITSISITIRSEELSNQIIVLPHNDYAHFRANVHNDAVHRFILDRVDENFIHIRY